MKSMCWRGALAAFAFVCLAGTSAFAGPDSIEVVKDEAGQKLVVNGEDFMVLGMNWGHMPIGQNYTYSLWLQPDDVITAALETEMSLLSAMGVNALRMYNGIPPKWIEYIYDRWGIWTILNHPMARYGFLIDGAWVEATDYSNPRLRELVTEEIVALVEEQKDTRGILMWMLGNENNYGLYWSSFEIEALPKGDQQAARARYLYSLFEDVTVAIQEIDDRPVTLCNGDLQFIDIIAEECPSMDVFSTNVYRGISAGGLYDEVKQKLDVPILYAEFGADAYNSRDNREDQAMQCRMLVGQWREIYEQSYGKGRVGNCIGGATFQWSDGWWKYKQTENLDVHDTNASWPNGGYEDFVPGENNMNEEWWGICAKGYPDHRFLYQLYPRAAYYALQQAYRLDPYGPETTLESIREHFGRISAAGTELLARGDRAALLAESGSKARISGLRLEFETYNTGGVRTSTPESNEPVSRSYPTNQGFDTMQSYWVDVEATPTQDVRGRVSVSILGDIAENAIDEIYYENRGRSTLFETTPNDSVEIGTTERVKVYTAGLTWNDRYFDLEGFYREGHFHWGYEGDFFGLYREAYYGENIDIYNGVAPVGMQFTGKKQFTGLAVALGPELWWGANPAVLGRYTRQIGGMTATVVAHEDIEEQSNIVSTIAIPLPKTRKVALGVETNYGPVGLQLGGIWSGDTKVGQTFQLYDEGTNSALADTVRNGDTFGFKGKAMLQRGRYNVYAQGAYMGLVADGGPDPMTTFTGWRLKDSGSGNQVNFLTGLAVNFGNFQFAPNFLWQKPIAPPIPGDVESPGRPRNVIDDPFAVRANREMTAAEFLIAYDPTPATWMWQWDNDIREDANFAASLGFVYRDYPTTQDAHIGFLADGRTVFAFPAATPPRDVWEVHSRMVSKLGTNSRLIAHLYGGIVEPLGDGTRIARRWGGDARVVAGPLSFSTFLKIDDHGPYDYHRDFLLTYPEQVMGDLSYSMGSPQFFGWPETKVGIRAMWRSLDENSPRYCPAEVPDPFGIPVCDPLAEGENGEEWEIRTYLHFAM